MPIGPIVRAMNHNRTRVALIILEIAVTLAIVTNCVNMIVDERTKMVRPSGFDDDNLVWLRSAPFRPEFREEQYILNHVDADLRLMKAIPGVQAVVNTNFVPWQGGGSSGDGEDRRHERRAGSHPDLLRQGRSLRHPRDEIDRRARLRSERLQLRPGKRQPEGRHRQQALAELLFKTPHAVGKQIEDGSGTYTVVGILDPFYNPYGWPIHEYVFFGPSTVGSFARGTRFLVRVEPGAMKSTIAAIDTALTKSNSGRVITMKTIDEIKSEYFSGGRLVMKGMTVVIALLVFVTALGIIGITSLSVAERTKQIGTRRALGATRGDILTHFILENWMVTTAGLILGIAATYGLNFLLVTHVSGVKMDWRYVAVGMVLLWVNGLVATIPPAMRGASVSPAVATRSV